MDRLADVDSRPERACGQIWVHAEFRETPRHAPDHPGSTAGPTREKQHLTLANRCVPDADLPPEPRGDTNWTNDPDAHGWMCWVA